MDDRNARRRLCHAGDLRGTGFGLRPVHLFPRPLDFNEERFVRAIEVMPGNRAVVHHAVVSVRAKESEDLDRPGVRDAHNRIAGTELFYQDGDTLRVRTDAPVHDNGCTVPNGGAALSGDVTRDRKAILTVFVVHTQQRRGPPRRADSRHHSQRCD